MFKALSRRMISIVFNAALERLEQKLDCVADRLEAMSVQLNHLNGVIQHMSGTLSADITTLQADVTAQAGAIQSAVTLIQGFNAALQAALQAAQNAGATPEQLQALTDLDTSLQSNTSSLAQAVAANPLPATEPPAAPATPPSP